MELSVIISTYNSEKWLKKVLTGFAVQTYQPFEIIIADDGSKQATRELIASFSGKFHYIKHVWHEDEGFRKCAILNKAILESASKYLVFTDGDCIPRKDFLQVHLENRSEKNFLSGGYFKLPMSISESISEEDIVDQKCFDIGWLKNKGLKASFKNLKLSKNKILSRTLNSLTTTTPSWNGHNASGWKDDILKVNGFDERMKYGGEDRELGERLENSGVSGVQIRYKAVCVHLDHSRGYVKEEDLISNRKIRDDTKKNLSIWTPYGIAKEKDTHVSVT